MIPVVYQDNMYEEHSEQKLPNTFKSLATIELKRCPPSSKLQDEYEEVFSEEDLSAIMFDEHNVETKEVNANNVSREQTMFSKGKDQTKIDEKQFNINHNTNKESFEDNPESEKVQFQNKDDFFDYLLNVVENSVKDIY